MAIEVVSAAIQEGSGNDVVTLPGQGGDGDEDGRHPGGGGHRRAPAVKGRDALLIRCGGGVLETRIDIAGLGKLKQSGGIVAGRETEGGSGDNGESAGVACVTGMEATVNLTGGESEFIFPGHKW